MKLSIIIPTLEEEKVIGKILKSLQELRGPQCEIIISDGHSSDRTVDIAKEYADKVIVHDGKTRQTIAGGRNAGAKVAVGDYIVFIDADVEIYDVSKFFARAESFFDTNQKIVGLTANVRIMKEFETIADRLNFDFINFIHRLANNVLGIGMAIGEFQMVRRSVFNSIGGYNEKIVVGEDQEFFRRLSKMGKTILPKDLTIYHTGRRIHKLGWFHIWVAWMKDGLVVTFFNKSVSKEWKIIR